MEATRRSRRLLTALALVAGCSGDPDDSRNVFPDRGVPDAAPDEGPLPGDGGTSPFPGAWRFDCINIHKLGEPVNGGLPIQGEQLNSRWKTDIQGFGLNILFRVEAFDEATGEATVGISSGVGGDSASQCREPSTDGAPFPTGTSTGPGFVARTTPTDDEPACSEAGQGARNFDVVVPPADILYIYAEDTRGVVLNCTPDGAGPQRPEAVPLRHARAQATLDEGGRRLAGELTACLVKSDLAGLCSCVTGCPRPMPAVSAGACQGCSGGSLSIEGPFGSLTPSPDCEARVGEPALELKATFNARRLPHQPGLCD